MAILQHGHYYHQVDVFARRRVRAGARGAGPSLAGVEIGSATAGHPERSQPATRQGREGAGGARPASRRRSARATSTSRSGRRRWSPSGGRPVGGLAPDRDDSLGYELPRSRPDPGDAGRGEAAEMGRGGGSAAREFGRVGRVPVRSSRRWRSEAGRTVRRTPAGLHARPGRGCRTPVQRVWTAPRVDRRLHDRGGRSRGRRGHRDIERSRLQPIRCCRPEGGVDPGSGFHAFEPPAPVT